MSEEHKVNVGDQEFSIASPSLDKTMRITDYISEVLEQIPGIFDEIETYRIEYKINHREVITKEEAEDPNNKEIVEALGININDFENEDNLILDDETGKQGVPFYKSPTEIELLSAVFPKIWKAARDNVVDLAALLIITDGQLEEHDKRGAINGLIKERAHWLKYNASLEELLDIVSIGVIIFKEQVESASKSLGKVTQNLTEMLGEAQTAEETPKETKQKKEPAQQEEEQK